MSTFKKLNEAKFKKGDMVVLGAPHFVKEIQAKSGDLLSYRDVFHVETQKDNKLTLRGSDGTFNADSKYFIMDESVIEEGAVSDAMMTSIEDYHKGIKKARSLETLVELTKKDSGEIEEILKKYSNDMDAMDKLMESLIETKNDFGNVDEARTSIKRKYGIHPSTDVNEKAPLRNAIIKNIGNKIMTEEQIRNMLIRVEEDRGKPINQTRWFKSNSRFFKMSKNESGDKTYQLSKLGKRIFDKTSQTKTTINMKLVAESLEEFISEKFKINKLDHDEYSWDFMVNDKWASNSKVHKALAKAGVEFSVGGNNGGLYVMGRDEDDKEAAIAALKSLGITEGRDKMMTAKVYDKLSDDEKMEKLLTVFKDPDEASDNLSKKFDDLGPVVQANMFESVNEATIEITKDMMDMLHKDGECDCSGHKLTYKKDSN